LRERIDEVLALAGLEDVARKKVQTFSGGMKRRLNLAVVYTTHYMEEVESLCDRVAIIDRGNIIAHDTVQALSGGTSGAALTVSCDNPDALAVGLRVADGVSDVLKAESGQVTFTCPSSSAGLATLVEVARTCGIEITDVDVARASLEQVFLRLTGRALRD
jgi:ABC-2 type transport system ATP-binding protein